MFIDKPMSPPLHHMSRRRPRIPLKDQRLPRRDVRNDPCDQLVDGDRDVWRMSRRSLTRYGSPKGRQQLQKMMDARRLSQMIELEANVEDYIHESLILTGDEKDEVMKADLENSLRTWFHNVSPLTAQSGGPYVRHLLPHLQRIAGREGKTVPLGSTTVKGLRLRSQFSVFGASTTFPDFGSTGSVFGFGEAVPTSAFAGFGSLGTAFGPGPGLVTTAFLDQSPRAGPSTDQATSPDQATPPDQATSPGST